MWLRRLQRFPNMALNPMEKGETTFIEFYDLKILSGGSGVLFRGGFSEMKAKREEKETSVL